MSLIVKPFKRKNYFFGWKVFNQLVVNINYQACQKHYRRFGHHKVKHKEICEYCPMLVVNKLWWNDLISTKKNIFPFEVVQLANITTSTNNICYHSASQEEYKIVGLVLFSFYLMTWFPRTRDHPFVIFTQHVIHSEYPGSASTMPH